MPRASASTNSTYSLRDAWGDGLVKGDWKGWKGARFHSDRGHIIRTGINLQIQHCWHGLQAF